MKHILTLAERFIIYFNHQLSIQHVNNNYYNARPNPLQYFLVPDIEVENGGEDEEDLEDSDSIDDVVEEECEEGAEEEEAEDEDEK